MLCNLTTAGSSTDSSNGSDTRHSNGKKRVGNSDKLGSKPGIRAKTKPAADRPSPSAASAAGALISPSLAPAALFLSVGLKIEPAGVTPKDEVMHEFRLNGHVPILRNSRRGYIIVICKHENKGCNASCGVSANQRDGWYVTTCDEAVGKKCKLAGMVVYGWCTVVILM